MARKFWERLGSQNIQFYRDPLQLNRDDTDARIADIQGILALDDEQKAILVGLNPNFDPFAALQDELEALADQRDYWDYDQIVENITVVERGWWTPADAVLGAGTITSVSSEQGGSEAIQAIDGVSGTEWMSAVDAAPHELVFGWQYKKKFDGIRWRVGPSIGNPQAWEGVSVWIANGQGGLDDDGNRVLEDVDIAVVGTHADPWLELDFSKKQTGRFCRITIAGTGRGDNRADAGEIELRANVITSGI